MVLPKRPMGCQFINAHSLPISAVFNFNTNISIGNVSHVYYGTLYTSKSTQEEDAEKQLRIGRGVIKRMKRLLEEKHLHPRTPGVVGGDISEDGTNQQRYEPSFGEGLSRLLSGLNAATTRNVISATMAHLISCNNGSRFIFSHDFSDLLVGQMEATLEGQDINVRIRTSKVPGGEFKCWPDSLADDYIHRPLQEEFENICYYDMTSRYKKNYKSHRPTSVDTYEFSESHPGFKFSHLSKIKHSTIPRIALPPNKLCSMEELELQHDNSTEKTHDAREMYAKMALLMFYPFRQLKDLKVDGSYWRQFHKQLQCQLKQKHTKFWENGFELLQNIEDRATLQKHVTRARDPITMVTINTKPDEATKKKQIHDVDQVADILEMGDQSR